MLSLIRNHSIKPMGRKAFTKRIVVIELIGFLGTFYYYANIEQVHRFIISLIKNGTGNVISSMFIWLIIGLRLLEFNYILRRAKDVGISWPGVLAFVVLANHFKLAKIGGLVALCIIEPRTIIKGSATVTGKITAHNSQDISVSKLNELDSEQVRKLLKKLPQEKEDIITKQ